MMLAASPSTNRVGSASRSRHFTASRPREEIRSLKPDLRRRRTSTAWSKRRRHAHDGCPPPPAGALHRTSTSPSDFLEDGDRRAVASPSRTAEDSAGARREGLSVHQALPGV
ncbi:MAG: hypothetical protein U1U88_001159 [Lawsonella clevelandensis]